MKLSASLLTCTFALAFYPQGQSFSETPGIQWYQSLPDYLLDEQANEGIQAFSFAITRDNKLIYSTSSGKYQDKLVNPETVFPSPALTPALTTLLAARLADKGRVSWDTPVASIYSRFRIGGSETKASLRHLLDMAAGIPGYLDDTLADSWSKSEDIYTIIRQTPSTALPGTRFEQSDTSIATAGYLLAKSVRAPGNNPAESYALAVQMEIFDPLGMKNSHIDTTLALASARGLHTCTHDLAMWVAAEAGTNIPNASFLSPLASLSKMQAVDLKGGRDYVLGWHIRFYENTRILARAGNYNGHTVFAGYLPEYHVGFAIWMVGKPEQTKGIVEELPLAITELVRPKDG